MIEHGERGLADRFFVAQRHLPLFFAMVTGHVAGLAAMRRAGEVEGSGDGCQVERAGPRRQEHKVGDAHGVENRAFGMRRRVDDAVGYAVAATTATAHVRKNISTAVETGGPKARMPK